MDTNIADGGAVLLALILVMLPEFARDLPMACAQSERFSSGDSDTELARCRPLDEATAGQWTLKLGEAMGRVGLHPIVRAGPLGPHIAAFSEGGMLSASIVASGPRFDIWISEAHFAAQMKAQPVLPKGASIVTDQSDDRHHLLTVALAVPLRESGALVDNTLAELGAQKLTHEAAGGGEIGRVRWLGREGSYQLQGHGAHMTYLMLFVGSAK